MVLRIKCSAPWASHVRTAASCQKHTLPLRVIYSWYYVTENLCCVH